MASKTFSISEDRIIYYTLLGSCLIHVCFLLFSFFVLPCVNKIKTKTMEIRYHAKPIQKIVEKTARIERVADLKETRKLSSSGSKNLIDKQLTGSALLRDTAKLSRRIDVPDKQPLKMTNLVEKRSISVPVIASQKITNPKYVGYNDRIRDKIRNRAYFYIDDPQFQAGEVYLTFVVTADGNLKDLQIIGERSRANEYLRTVGLRSVKESSPFPPFPADLQYPELSFNVVISFEVGE
ncbi:MAG: TonB C-terminal domain-containing protein [Candidatus Omnitrophica bacterium]|nr:TonB C-terminal domain-containing protein [Candidatus Omnitrophota bacterium]